MKDSIKQWEHFKNVYSLVLPPWRVQRQNHSWGSHQPVGWPPKLIKELLIQQIREVPRVSQGIPTLTLSTIVSIHSQKKQCSSSLLFLTALHFRLLQAPCLPTGSSSSFWSGTTDFWGQNLIRLRELQLLKSSMSKHTQVGANPFKNLCHSALYYLSMPFAMKKPLNDISSLHLIWQ